MREFTGSNNTQGHGQSSCEVVEPPPPVVAVDVLNVQGTRNGKETFDSTMNMKAAEKQIKGKKEEKKVDAMQSHFKCLGGCRFI
ncbi:hypothetical protein Pyn_21407 [Prunus yedoensis var. nudiflora]|uniref:Uncharacterized protein n=1 Tax=Prunus yedoensis var. nudiflora TaxID=2094558 RepID=A0A315AST1_PRUYE|nr:hypothetical protein Pyn_21407 [Prunus yedoensis var. nudiflora]